MYTKKEEQRKALQYHEALLHNASFIYDSLSLLGLQGFNFMRIHKNGNYISLVNNIDYLRSYIDNIDNIGFFF